MVYTDSNDHHLVASGDVRRYRMALAARALVSGCIPAFRASSVKRDHVSDALEVSP